MPDYPLNWIVEHIAVGYAPRSHADLETIHTQSIKAPLLRPRIMWSMNQIRFLKKWTAMQKWFDTEDWLICSIFRALPDSCGSERQKVEPPAVLVWSSGCSPGSVHIYRLRFLKALLRLLRFPLLSFLWGNRPCFASVPPARGLPRPWPPESNPDALREHLRRYHHWFHSRFAFFSLWHAIQNPILKWTPFIRSIRSMIPWHSLHSISFLICRWWLKTTCSGR